MKNVWLLPILLLLSLSGGCLAGPSTKGETALAAGDYSTALQVFRPLAEQGDARAQFNIAKMYYSGQGVSQDYAQAVSWHRKAAAQGNAEKPGSVLEFALVLNTPNTSRACGQQ